MASQSQSLSSSIEMDAQEPGTDGGWALESNNKQDLSISGLHKMGHSISSQETNETISIASDSEEDSVMVEREEIYG